MKSSEFRVLTDSPLNGSPSLDALVRAHATPVEDFFVRNHGDAPSAANWELRVTGLVHTPLTLSPFPFPTETFARSEVEATLQCAGNRRAALQKVHPVPNEIPWDNGAIGNAVWEGVRLGDVLLHAGLLDGATHVWFTGGDVLNGQHAGQQFGASIPIAKALHPATILADVMNGSPLTTEHGAPVRVIVPGFIGARSVKWLSEIRVESEPTPNHFQRAYSVKDRVLDEFPISSAFGDPVDGATVPAGTATVKGWSITGGTRTVARVDVSANGGKSWAPARFLSTPRPFVWQLWEADCSLAPGTHELVCRAIDNAGNAQPDAPLATWNVKGYVNNCWDRITIHAT
jgi:sulfite oxidase